MQREDGTNGLKLLVDIASNPHHQLLRNMEAATNGEGSSPIIKSNLVLPKLLIQLTNKEKEEDFMAFEGSKLPQRPRKRAKLVQQTINLMCPGSWMCDLSLERYGVRDNIAKQRTGGLKGMRDTESDSDQDFGKNKENETVRN